MDSRNGSGHLRVQSASSGADKETIENVFFQSFLYYVPYITLAVMTFPAIIEATQSPVAGAAALIAGIVCAWIGANLYQVAIACCVVVFVLEFFLCR